MKLVYRYIEPKTEEEKKDQQDKLDRIYNALFDTALEELRREGKIRF